MPKLKGEEIISWAVGGVSRDAAKKSPTPALVTSQCLNYCLFPGHSRRGAFDQLVFDSNFLTLDSISGAWGLRSRRHSEVEQFGRRAFNPQ